jgi:hypothetical protein
MVNVPTISIPIRALKILAVPDPKGPQRERERERKHTWLVHTIPPRFVVGSRYSLQLGLLSNTLLLLLAGPTVQGICERPGMLLVVPDTFDPSLIFSFIPPLKKWAFCSNVS